MSDHAPLKLVIELPQFYNQIGWRLAEYQEPNDKNQKYKQEDEFEEETKSLKQVK